MSKQKLVGCLKKNAIIALPVTLVALIFNAWFLRMGIRTSGDWGFMLKETSDTLRRHYFSMWLSDTSFGRVLIDVGQAPSYAVYGWLSYYFDIGYALAERMVHLWPAVIFALLSAYFLVHYILKDRLAGVLGAVVYAANTYYLALLTGHLTLAVAYALAPLVVLFYLKAANTQRVRDIILCALTFAVAGAYEPRSAYILFLTLAALAIYHFFFIYLPRHHLTVKLFIKMAAVYAAPFVVFGLLNIYWVVGLAFAGGSDGTTIESSLFGNEFFNISEALTLHHPFWTGGPIEPFVVHAIPFYFWLIPVVAFAGFAVNRQNRTLLFFAVVAVIGVLLAKQSAEPLPSLYQWLFSTVPGFNAFREASKFYLLTSLAYAVLIPSLYWFVKKRFADRRWMHVTLFVGICALFAPNLVPVATNNIGATFAERSMPAQYQTINEFLNEDRYGRVLWVPQKSRWSFMSADHPAINASKLISDPRTDLRGAYASMDNATTTDEIQDLLTQDYMPVILSNAGVKYVVVPLRDTKNADNFYRSYNDDPALFADTLARAGYLEPAAISVKGFTVYQAKTPIKPYFSATTDVYTVPDSRQLPAAYKLWQESAQKGEFNFVINEEGKPYVGDVTQLFARFSQENLEEGVLTSPAVDAGKRPAYYFDEEYSELAYRADASVLTLERRRPVLPGTLTVQSIAEQRVSLKNQDYIIKTDAGITVVERTGKTKYLGSPRENTQLYAIESANLLAKGTEKGNMWERQVRNCVPYGRSARISMESKLDNKRNKEVLSLFAKDHAACTGPPAVSVEPGKEYLWRFAYRSENAQLISYRLTYNTARNAVVTKTFPVSDNEWHTYETVIAVPEGATSVRAELIARPSNQAKASAITSYDDISLLALNKVAEVPTARRYALQAAEKAPDLQKATYPAYPYKNLIPNPSFEAGLWKKKVGDCNAYDERPALRMSLHNGGADNSRRALQLEAQRHTACTNTPAIAVEGGATYVLRFAYQSPNAPSAGYVVSLNDKNKTRISDRIATRGKEWQTYERIITIPTDATSLSLAVFAYSSDNNQAPYMVNRYDEFVLQRIPDAKERFYALTRPQTELGVPKHIAYQHDTNTLKRVTITGADKPFILRMSEQYHAGWKLLLGDFREISRPMLMAWKPLPKVPAEQQLKLNGFQNGWYIDPAQVCTAAPTACTKQADGSYDIRLTASFNAQRWLNLGLVISGGTLVGCLAVLTFVTVKHWYPISSNVVRRTYGKAKRK